MSCANAYACICFSDMFCKSYYPSESIKMKPTGPAVLITYLSRYPDFFLRTEKHTHTHTLLPNRVAVLGVFYYFIHSLLYNIVLKYNTNYKNGKTVESTFPHAIKWNYLSFRGKQNKKGYKINFFRCLNYLYHWLSDQLWKFRFSLKTITFC